MAKTVYVNAQDAALTAQRGTHQAVVSGASAPADYTAMVAATLANGVLGGTTPASPSLGAGTPTGRADTYPAATGLSITADGDATHVVTHDNAATVFLATTVPTQTLTSGGTVDVSQWANNLNDPAP